MRKSIFQIFFIFIVGIAGGIFADQILWPYFVERPLFYQFKLQPQGNIVEKKEIIIQENVALQEAIGKIEKTVVAVQAQTKGGKVLEGSGFILTSDGLIVTLAELLPAGSNFSIFWEGEQLSFQVLKKDTKNNLALIKVEKKNLPVAGFGEREKRRLGQRVFVLGALVTNNKFQKLVNEGIIKTFDENLILTNMVEKNNISGSPLFDIEGKVVGSGTIGREGELSAIPIEKIREFAGL